MSPNSSSRPRSRIFRQEVVELGKKSILDGFGLALSGSVAKSGELVRQHLDDLGLGDGAATVIGGGRKVAPRFAAFANGVGIHADDYDDTQLAVAKDRVYGLLTHPTAPALPAAFAIGRSDEGYRRRTSCWPIISASKSSARSPKRSRRATTRPVSTRQRPAAHSRPPPPRSKLMGFDVATTQRALSIAGSQSAGLRENFGTMTKPFHAGRSSESGVAAAQFASYGWTATSRILEAPRGFFAAAGGGYDQSAIFGKLGAPWTFANPGVSIKPHPSGSLTHPGMTEMLRLIKENGIRAEDVKHVRVGTNSNMPNALIHHRPKDELQAKFSMEFCMAILLLEGRAGLNEFTDAAVEREDVKAMIEKVDFVIDDEAEAAGYHLMTTIIDIDLKDGRRDFRPRRLRQGQSGLSDEL